MFHSLSLDSSSVFLTAFLCLLTLPATPVTAAPATTQSVGSAYAPKTGLSCPGQPLVRPAEGLGAQEQDYISHRKPIADQALLQWLEKVSPGSWTSGGYSSAQNLPLIAHSSSGGGFRALLNGAGAIKAMDARDSTSGLAGLYQACTYHTGLSGGSWLLSSFAGNNWPTISSLVEGLWLSKFNSGLWSASFTWHNNLFFDIVEDLIAKGRAGFDVVFDDAWGRLLSDVLLYGDQGGVGKTLSGLADNSNMTSYMAPYPIMLAQGVNVAADQCFPDINSTIYEFAPFEFGSWDRGVAAFTPTRYMGTPVNYNRPLRDDACVVGFDNLGYALGASSNLFNEQYCQTAANSSSVSSGISKLLWDIVKAAAHTLNVDIDYATIPNPFRNRTDSPLVANDTLLTLVDGGEAPFGAESAQNDPIWPLLRPERNVDVIITSDTSSDTPDNYPDGSALRVTVDAANYAGIGYRMPPIPDQASYDAAGLGQKVSIFGCYSPEAVTIVYMPNTNISFPSGQSTYKMQYNATETQGMIANGELVATYNNAEDWPKCLACGIMAKTKLYANADMKTHANETSSVVARAADAECEPCLRKYCYS